jgi:hypothetical protein
MSMSGMERAEQAMERWREGYKRKRKPDEPVREEDEQGGFSVEGGFCIRAINAVRCPKCGAEKKEWCRQADGHKRHSRVFIHNARRHTYLSFLQGDKDERSNISGSPIVGSTVFVVPIDRQAAWVVSKGAQWTRAGKSFRSMGPLKTRAVPDDMPSMLGMVRGELCVVGLSASHTGKSGNGGAAAWICRCSCGYYVLRTTKAIRNESNDDRCEICARTVQLKRAETFRQTGVWPERRDVDGGQSE